MPALPHSSYERRELFVPYSREEASDKSISAFGEGKGGLCDCSCSSKGNLVPCKLLKSFRQAFMWVWFSLFLPLHVRVHQRLVGEVTVCVSGDQDTVLLSFAMSARSSLRFCVKLSTLRSPKGVNPSTGNHSSCICCRV